MSAPRPDPPAWPGLRPLHVLRRTLECQDVVSLVLGGEDGGRLPAFRPGQFVTLALDLPGPGRAEGRPARPSDRSGASSGLVSPRDASAALGTTSAEGRARPLLAVYSLSGRAGDATWRITLKDLAPSGPPGARGSSWLARGVKVGDVVAARAPAGHFGFDVEGRGPVVLVAGGIGVTPFVPMLHEAAAARAPRPITVVLGMRRGEEHPLRDEVASTVRAVRGARLVTTYSQPGPTDLRGGARAGRVDAALLQDVLPPADDPYTFLLCGPPPMLHDVQAALRGLGVPDSAVRIEVFGQAAVRATSRLRPAVAGVAGVQVEFARSGKTVPWDPEAEALLYLAERHGVPIPYACAAGRCGACLTPLRSGKVEHRVSPEAPSLRPGFCLPCVAVPVEDVVLDA